MNITVKTEKTNDFMARIREAFTSLDKGEKPEVSYAISFDDPNDLLSFLTRNRLTLFKSIRDHKRVTMPELAHEMRRDSSSIRRDVNRLEEVGLVHSWLEVNPKGHGKIRVVEPAATDSILLQAAL